MAWGLLAAVASALANGTFGVFSKVEPVRNAEVSPIVFNFWVSLGIVFSSLPLFLLRPLVITPWGLLSGALFVASTACAFAAIHRLGLSAASGIWCGVAVVVSFVFGVKTGDAIQHPGMAAPGIMLLVIGIAAVALNGQIASARQLLEEEGDDAQLATASSARAALAPELSGDSDAAGGGADLEQPMLRIKHEVKKRRTERAERYLSGIVLSTVAGFCGGLILAPMRLAPPQVQGLHFIPSMALGVLLAAPVITGLLLAGEYVRSGRLPAQRARVAAPYGLVSGLVWNLGNLCSVVAVSDPDVGLAIGYPIMQCGLFVAGLWGILLFRELRGKETAAFWLSSGLLVLGAIMLSMSK